jgi:hypothetical protein
MAKLSVERFWHRMPKNVLKKFCIPVEMCTYSYCCLSTCLNGRLWFVYQTKGHITQHQSLWCCASPDDCWLLTVHSEGLDHEWQEFVLSYDHGEPRCSHTACLFPTAGELLIHSGSTQPFYETRIKLKVNTVCVCSVFGQGESTCYLQVIIFCVVTYYFSALPHSKSCLLFKEFSPYKASKFCISVMIVSSVLQVFIIKW